MGKAPYCHSGNTGTAALRHWVPLGLGTSQNDMCREPWMTPLTETGGTRLTGGVCTMPRMCVIWSRASARARTTHTHTHMHTHACSIPYSTVQAVSVHLEHCYQSCLQVLQRKLQRKPGPDTNTRNTQRGHMPQRLVLMAHYNLGSAKSSLSISEHLSVTSLTSWRDKPLHQESSRSAHAAQRCKQHCG